MVKEYTGLKILGILSVLSGLLMFLGGIWVMSAGGEMVEDGADSIIGILAIMPVGLSVVVMGGAMLVFGLFVAFLGYKVYKHVRWAYWVYFALTIIGLLGSLVSLQIIGIVFGGLIAWYLWSIRESFMADSDVKTVWSD